MKILMPLFCCLSFSVSAKDIYIPPIVPTEKEAKQAQIEMETNKLVLRKHWQARLEAVKQKESTLSTIDTLPNNSGQPDNPHQH